MIRGTLKEGVSEASLSDVSLDTAVQQHTGYELVHDIELCRCPEGYTGSSCEVILISSLDSNGLKDRIRKNLN